jgi:hypothetical protein
MKFHALAWLLLLSMSPVLRAQESTARLKVLAYQWTTTHHTMTFSWPGYANTSCNGNGTIIGYTSGNNISASETSSSSCSTTYTPPNNQEIDIQKPVVFILAETETTRMILTCTRNVRWSQCHALNPGFFTARNNNGHFEIQAVSGKGKEEWVKFDIVQQNAITNQETETRSVADNSTTSGPAVAEAASVVPVAPTIEAPESGAVAENMGFPSKWKSMTTGSVRTLRFETDYIYGEVILSEAAVKAGAFTLLELKKDGNKYVGKVNAKFVRSDGGASCSVHAPMELTLVTPERIEGNNQSPPANARIDWAKCSFTPPPERQDFVWIPVR